MLSRPPAAPDAAFSIPASAFSVFSLSVSTALVSVFSAPASACSASEPAPAFHHLYLHGFWKHQMSVVEIPRSSGMVFLVDDIFPVCLSIIRKGSPDTSQKMHSSICFLQERLQRGALLPWLRRDFLSSDLRDTRFFAPETGVRPARRLPQTDLLCSGDNPSPPASEPSILHGRYTIPAEKSTAAAPPNQERSSEDRLFPLASNFILSNSSPGIMLSRTCPAADPGEIFSGITVTGE